MAEREVKVPELGDFEDVEVIEVLVKAGDKVEKEDPLITLESDKASMEVPSTAAGTVAQVKVKEGDKVSEGDVIVTLEGAGEEPAEESPKQASPAARQPTSEAQSGAAQSPPQSQDEDQPPETTEGETVEVRVPELGDFEDVEVIEVLVKPGDSVDEEDPLITLESDKASLEVPSTAAGTVEQLQVKEGDRVSEGDVILSVKTAGESRTRQPQKQRETAGGGEARAQPRETAAADTPKPARQASSATAAGASEGAGRPAPADGSHLAAVDEKAFSKAHASPSVRRYARQLGVDLGRIEGSGPKERILKEDVERYVKSLVRAAQDGAAGGTGMARMPEVDFSRFGEVEEKPLPRIRRLSAENVHRSWLVVPHVTQFDDADVTELEAFRRAENQRVEVKLTPLPFIIKACAAAIDRYPEFASSLDPSGETLIMKHYRHIGFAVDTDNGLLVPVLRDVDKKGITEIASEAAELTEKARSGRIRSADMQGSVFSVSSLGGIGGTAFTPIVNAPDVAILGVSRAETRPVWDGEQFVPRTLLPLSLSYDHRVIDGAKAARFTRYLAEVLTDIRRLVL